MPEHAASAGHRIAAAKRRGVIVETLSPVFLSSAKLCWCKMSARRHSMPGFN